MNPAEKARIAVILLTEAVQEASSVNPAFGSFEIMKELGLLNSGIAFSSRMIKIDVGNLPVRSCCPETSNVRFIDPLSPQSSDGTT